MAGSGIGIKITYPATVTQLVNVALLRIGANTISSIADGSPNALKATAVWEYVRDEVLQAKNWKFSKIRAALLRYSVAPLYAYQFAYVMPSDFMRLVKPHGKGSLPSNPAIAVGGFSLSANTFISSESSIDFDPPVYPPGFPYVVEVIPGDSEADPPTTDTLCLLTDYDDTNQDLIINYIRRVVDESLYTATFKNCLINRLAQELAISITESIPKSQLMEQQYQKLLYSAEAVNESMDYLDNETGSSSWENAGR
jgi:hypothetical protein